MFPVPGSVAPPSPQWYGTWNTYILLYSVVLFCIPSLRSVFWPNLSTGLSGNQIQSNSQQQGLLGFNL